MLDEALRDFLHYKNIRLDTDKGQHFLIDEIILQKIVDAAKLTTEDRVIEIGPGIGILTRELVQKARAVTAIEIDARFPPLVREFCNNPTNLIIVQGNALHAPIDTDTPYKVVANIPYHITSPLLHRFLLEVPRRPLSMTLLIQREVADNICDDGTASILTLLVALFGKATMVTHVPNKAFLPPPKVESAVIHIDLYDEPLAQRPNIKKILGLCKVATSQRRKMLNNSIGKLPNGMEVLKKAGIDATRRPQTLTVQEWIRLEQVMNG